MGRKLLVADDSVTIQKVIKLALSSEGYDILTVSEGKDAIRAIQEERPDVVLIDVTLPGADAYAVKRAINAVPSLASVGFILMLSAFERVDEDAIASVVFQGRLIKPFDPSHLRKAVADVLASKGASAAPAAAAPPPTAITPKPPEASISAPPPPPGAMDDLPPIRDMHPTLPEEHPPQMTEEDFLGDTSPPLSVVPPAEVTRISLEVPEPKTAPSTLMPATSFSLPSADAATFDISAEQSPESTIAPPPAPQQPPEERTDPNFSLPDEAVVRSIENDIKDLTESTIKMSGLDEWNLEDSGKMKDSGERPVIEVKPPAERKAPGTTLRPPEPKPPEMRPPEMRAPELKAAPPAAIAGPTPPHEKTREMTMPSIDKKAAILRGLMSPPTHSIDDGDSTFPISTLKPGAQPNKTTPKAAFPPKPIEVAPPPAAEPESEPESGGTPASTISIVGSVGLGRDYVGPSIQPPSIPIAPPAHKEPKVESFATAAPALTRAEIEQLVRKDLEAAIEKFAREAFPRIVEQVIRQEIEKLLVD